MPADGRASARILIVEDEPVLALDLEQVLIESGFAIAGIAGTLDKALALIEQGAVDAAIVDTNLAGVSATPVAAMLTARGLPFIVTSGYSPEQHADVIRAAPFVEKPCRPERIIEALQRCLAKR